MGHAAIKDRSAHAPCLLIVTADRQLDLRLRDALTGLPYPAVTAENCVQAMRLLANPHPPQIALLDSALPDGSGFDLALATKHTCGRKLTWMVLLLRSDANPATVTLAAEAGIDDVLLSTGGEPIDKTELHIRLSVGARMQTLTEQLEAETRTSRAEPSLDSLTEVWSREALLKLLFPETDRVQRLGAPMTLALLDLDQFARVNNEHGYDTGSRILREFARRLRRYLRSYDLMGRMGEDEFLIALPGCAMQQALHLSRRIRTVLLHRPFIAERRSLTLTASIGLAPSRGRSPLVVLREAESALAAAKQYGRNCEREYAAPHLTLVEKPSASRPASTRPQSSSLL